MNRYKYPRTRHAPWSRSKGEDDKEHSTMEQFIGREVVVTEKMDGENTTMYTDHYHARSLDSRHHPSRDAVKAIWGGIRYMIPEGFRLCGENVYAEHSIAYDDLESFFLGFSVWDDRNVKLAYDDGLKLMREWGVTPVRELYRGTYDEKVIKALWTPAHAAKVEGYVIQVVEEIPYEDFGTYVAKFVRPKHVQTDEHWMTKAVVANKLKG
jgi:hypothetical protein